MSKKIISLLLSLCIICSAFVGVGAISVSAEAATEYSAGDVILDFEDTTSYTVSSNISYNTADTSFNGTQTAVLALEASQAFCEAVFTFNTPIALADSVIALDVAKLFRSDRARVSLYNGDTCLATVQASIPNHENVYPYSTHSSYTVYFNFGSVADLSNITAIGVSAAKYAYSQNFEFDNIRVLENTDGEFNAGIDNIESTNALSINDEGMFANSTGATSTEEWGGFTIGYIDLKNAITLPGSTVQFEATGVRWHDYVYLELYNGTTKISGTGYTPGASSTSLGGVIGTNTNKTFTFKTATDLTGQTVTRIVIVAVNAYTGYESKLSIKNIHFPSALETASAPTVSGTEISVDEDNAYTNGRMVINGAVAEADLNKTVAADGIAITEVGAVVMPVNNFSGELTLETEGASSASFAPAASYSVTVVNDYDYSDITLAVRTYAVWTDGTNTRTVYSDVYNTLGVDSGVDVVMGDATGDNNVNILDFIAIVKGQTEAVSVFYQADVNADNAIDADDMVAIKKFLLGIENSLAARPYVADDTVIGDWIIDYKTTILDFEDTTDYTVTSNYAVTYLAEDASFNGTKTAVLTTPVSQTFEEYTFNLNQPVALADSIIALEAGLMFGTDRAKLALYNGDTQLAEVSSILPSNSIATPYGAHNNYILYFDFSSLTKAQLNCITAIKISAFKYAYKQNLQIDNLRTVSNANGEFDNIESTQLLKINSDGMLTNTSTKANEWETFPIGYVDFKNNVTLTSNTITVNVNAKSYVEYMFIELYNGATKIAGTGWNGSVNTSLGGAVGKISGNTTGQFTFTAPEDIVGQTVTRAVIYCQHGYNDYASSIAFNGLNFVTAQ